MPSFRGYADPLHSEFAYDRVRKRGYNVMDYTNTVCRVERPPCLFPAGTRHRFRGAICGGLMLMDVSVATTIAGER